MSEKQRSTVGNGKLAGSSQLFLLSPVDREKLRQEAFKRGVSISALIREALTKYLGWKR